MRQQTIKAQTSLFKKARFYFKFLSNPLYWVTVIASLCVLFSSKTIGAYLAAAGSAVYYHLPLSLVQYANPDRPTLGGVVSIGAFYFILTYFRERKHEAVGIAVALLIAQFLTIPFSFIEGYYSAGSLGWQTVYTQQGTHYALAQEAQGFHYLDDSEPDIPQGMRGYTQESNKPSVFIRINEANATFDGEYIVVVAKPRILVTTEHTGVLTYHAKQ